MHRQPKGADIDRPQRSMKRRIRRWLRVVLKRDTMRQIQEALVS